jgi:hypothetical protein
MARAPLSATAPTEVISVRLTKDTLDRVREQARDEDRPLTAHVRHIVKRHVERAADARIAVVEAES